jgi:hypothetical protein
VEYPISLYANFATDVFLIDWCVAERDLDSPYDVMMDADPYEDVLGKDWMEDGFDERVMVQTAAFDWPDDMLANEARGLLDDLEQSRDDWKAPDVQLARIVKAGGDEFVVMSTDEKRH